jgi:hypothetical protein
LTDKEGVHATESVGWLYIFEGEVEVVLGEGEGTELRAGAVVIQNGTDLLVHRVGGHRCPVSSY